MRILACVRVCVWSFVYKGESCGLRSGSSSEAGTLNISVLRCWMSVFLLAILIRRKLLNAVMFTTQMDPRTGRQGW